MDLLLLILLLVLSAFFAAAETAFYSLRQPELATLRHGTGARRRVVLLLGRSDRLLPALLIGNLIVNTAAGVVGTAALIERFGGAGVALAIPALTLLIVVVGEITPKLIALRYRQKLAPLFEPPVAAWVGALRPVLALIAGATRRLMAALPGEGAASRPLSAAELEAACDLAIEEGSLTETEGRFLARLLGMQGLVVRQIMTPRPDVATLDAGLTRREVLAAARARGFNRYPVTVPDRALPIGFLHLKDLLARRGEERPLAHGLRAPLFVPESKGVAALLSEMRTSRMHLAMVVDEHGDFTGIVTLDDCLQALTGPIGGESDRQEPEIFPVDEDRWVASGRLDLRALNQVCGTTLQPSIEYVTIAGLLMARLGRIPRQGDRLVERGFAFTVLEMSGHALKRVRVERLAGAGPEGHA